MMFATLLETNAKRERKGWGTAVSVAAHGAIVLLLVCATRSDARPRPPRAAVDGPVIWTQPSEARARGETMGITGGSARSAERRFTLPSPDLAGTNIDVAVPADPAFTLPGGAHILEDIAGSGSGAAGGVSADGAGGVASELTVDERVGVVSERRPRYPEVLRAAGVTGVVTARFVVDTTGRADMHSLTVVESPNDQLTDAVLAAIRGTRFTPGRVRGRAVPTLVQRSFRFELEGAR